MASTGKTYVVEHLDDELGAWSELEYMTIAKESHENGASFLLTSVPASLELPERLKTLPGVVAKPQSVEELYPEKSRVCLLDPSATKELSPEDGDIFDVFLFGGILGDDPPRDRTSELRKKGFEGRRLGAMQMTTDTAVRVTRIVTQDRTPLEDIPWIDNPEIKVSRVESVEMPFRYVKGKNGEITVPEGMIDLIKADSEKGFGDLF
ncbi:hypothetical protein VC83_04032 [Pseudogymnoascus destructans]|uniref:Uncharacterized protein n=2 Tax=Pseudogymnoascus destructans TaxID=655981 RepID=L8G045_PSED2|nr:uncharacterized protein VC83_04032 [Pseudogymnoascus destructans]ELR06610.1 hypothetical protein GMDG_08083 [Pseudogymnoascus destructans 20631-21]OAF59569.1 hypothetical protein VC83_04032 [Pseudogymnoascus destructans]